MNDLLFEELMDCTQLKYSFLKSMLCGDAVIVAALKRWDYIGFLDGITSETKREIVAIAYDNLAYKLINEFDDYEYLNDKFADVFDAGFEVFLFALLRRVFDNIDIDVVDEIDIDEFLDLVDYYSFLSIDLDNIDDEYIDTEAEYCAILSLVIANKINKNKEDKE